jgi:hypothetical protein
VILERITTWLEKIGDRLNPILVKETRQALKSRQFTGTFMLLLVASLLVSFGGVALVGPNIDYSAAGSSFFVAYFAVLVFAIFLVVPFSAYRSLAAEQEERTYELLSITTLKPSQIVVGKLFSAMIQMFIYYSAIAPFMAFTFLLKGIDIFVIVFLLFLSLLGSVAFSMVGLFFATFSTRRSWQVLLTVVMIGGLGFVTIGSVPLAWEIVEFAGGDLRNEYFWIAMAALMTGYVLGFALVLQLSVSQLTFESDNRSSKVRIVLVLQSLAALAWTAWGWMVEEQGDRELLEVSAATGCISWAIVGSFLIAEPAGLSPRVARQIPRGGVGRALATLFFPGPGTGLAFTFIHLACIVAVVGLAELLEPWIVVITRPRGTRGDATVLTLAMASYAFLYLGLGASIVRLIRRFRPVPPIGGAAITVILVLLGTLTPNFFVAFRRMLYTTYEFWQISDPFATIDQIIKDPQIESALVLAPLGLAALCFLLNLPAMAREVFAISLAGAQGRTAPEPEAAPVATEPVELTAAAEPAAGV